jgi:hypothetical protein
MSALPIVISTSPRGDLLAGKCTWCLCEFSGTDARPLNSVTLLGKVYGDVPDKLMVCGHACKQNFDTPRKRGFKKQQGIIDGLYVDIMQTNVRVGDTVRVLEDKSSCRDVEAFGWGLVTRICFDRTRGCAEIFVKVLDTTVRVWPAGVRRVDAKENEGCSISRQRSSRAAPLVERSNQMAQLELLTVKCDSLSKRAAGAEAAVSASTRFEAELLEANAALRRERERANAEAGATIHTAYI